MKISSTRKFDKKEEGKMSIDNWWQCPRSSWELETRGETNWPVSSAPLKKRRKARKFTNETTGACPDDILGNLILGQAQGVDRSSVLDNEGYPKLGQKLSKRKITSLKNTIVNDDESLENVTDFQSVEIRTESIEEDNINSVKKCSKRTKRSTELICIELRKVLQRHRSLSESQITNSTTKPRIELNSNLSIRNPLDSSQIRHCRKGKLEREIPRPKRLSKLRKVIFMERTLKGREMNIWKRGKFDLEKIKAMTKEVSEIDFGKLKISGAPKPEVKLTKNISTMSLFDNNYRIPQADNLPDDVTTEASNNNDVITKLQNLLLEKDDCDIESEETTQCLCSSTSNDNNFCQKNHFQRMNLSEKAFSLKICDETGETVKEFQEMEIAPSVTNDSLKTMENKTADIFTVQNNLGHSKNFREYCTNDIIPSLNKTSENFLAEIYRLQKRMYERDEVKGRSRRRFYAGFKEVLKHIESKKIKFVFIAPDLEGIPGYPGGLDETVRNLIAACKVREIVFCFSLNRRKLGYYTHKKGSVSCVGITNYSGLEEIFKDVLTELIQARNSYEKKIFSYYGEKRSDKTGAATTLNPFENQDWNDALLSTKINLLLKSLTACN